MSDALARYRMAERQDKDALKRYKDASTGDTLGALAKYLGLQGYFDRQGKLSNEGLAWANQGFGRVRGGDPLGLLDELGGVASYLASPVTALVPTRDEIAASQLPEWAKPVMSGVSQGALVALPGPDLGPAASAAGRTARGVGEQAQMYMDDFAQKFGAEIPAGAEVYGSGPVLRKPLGRGLGDMIGDATDAERAALAGRLETEAAQTGGQAVTTSRDQALRNLTEAPAWNPSALKDKYAAMSREDLLAEAVKRGGVANADKLSAPKLRQALFDIDVLDEQSRNLGKMVDRSLKDDPTSWQ